MQHKLMFPFPEMVIPARLPAPSGTFTRSFPTASDPEFSRILLPVYPYTEYSGSLSIAPEGSPVLGSDPEMIIPFAGYLDHGPGIFPERTAQTMGKQIA